MATVRDYFEGWFDGDPVRMERALHKDLVKRRAGDDLGVTTKEQMLEFTRRGEGKEDGVDRTLDIEVDGPLRGHRQRHCQLRRLPRVRAARANPRRLEDRERALAAHVTEAANKTSARSAAEEALLDAAERLLVDVGYAGITTRRLAEEAGVNHGLVHYYFGSNENLLVRALERFTERLIARQRELYAADMPFVEKWRTAMRYLVSEDVTYEKVWLELQALAWNHPELRERLAGVNAEWRAVLTEAFEQPRRELGIEMPLEALVSLVMTFNIGIAVERLGGIDAGHSELLDWIDRWLSS